MIQSINKTANYATRQAVGDMSTMQVESLVVCAEKPDIALIEEPLKKLMDEASGQDKEALESIFNAATEKDKQKFNLIVQTAVSELRQTDWHPSSESQEIIANIHIFSNDNISVEQDWLDNFVELVEGLRISHLRNIAKKGTDLHGERHYTAGRQPDDDPATIGRIQAAKEVLDVADIDAQAEALLMNVKESGALDGMDPPVITIVRFVKDYSKANANNNVFTHVYYEVLKDAIERKAEEIFTDSSVSIEEQPVLMLTNTNRTNATAVERLYRLPLFAEEDFSGKAVILADDHINAGAFLCSLHSHVRENGGNVVGIATFSRHPHCSTLQVPEEIINVLDSYANPDGMDELLSNIGLSRDTLTPREALTLIALTIDGANQPEQLEQFEALRSAVSVAEKKTIPGENDDLLDIAKQPAMSIGDLKEELVNGLQKTRDADKKGMVI